MRRALVLAAARAGLVLKLLTLYLAAWHARTSPFTFRLVVNAGAWLDRLVSGPGWPLDRFFRGQPYMALEAAVRHPEASCAAGSPHVFAVVRWGPRWRRRYALCCWECRALEGPYRTFRQAREALREWRDDATLGADSS